MHAWRVHLSSVGWTFLQYLEPERSWEVAPSVEPSKPGAGRGSLSCKTVMWNLRVASGDLQYNSTLYLQVQEACQDMRPPGLVDLYRNQDKHFFNQYKRF
jgi:hypothetical protein